MASWAEFEAQAPALAAPIRTQLGAHIHAVLATLRRNGSPRLSGLETRFSDGKLWLAMMPDSRKAVDLRRDPHFALHSVPEAELVDGDAKLNGRAVELTDASLTRVQDNELVIDSWRDGAAPRQTRRQ